ncbi:ABC transporter permease [Georgenia sp. SUBG003]|uniref:ABC transporter permease n=1 Tax=Georgenia sp. SUBG003 TaxID=1497974 RepID=UPI0004D42600|nr:hypothetical protein DA06_02600 [Georgenia sp. SUBG003]
MSDHETRRVTELPSADLSGLRPVGRRPPFVSYVRGLLQRRHFIVADARARALTRHRGTLLNNGWLVLQPLLNGVTFYVIFGLLLQTSRGIDNFVGYLLVGVFLFEFTSRCLNQGATAVAGGRNLVRAFTFPRASLPVAVVVREAFGMAPVLVTMAVLILAVPPHAPVTWLWLLFPAVLALQTVFNLGLALAAARVTAQLPDVRVLLGFVTRFWMYGSAVMFSYEQFVEDPTLLAVLELNPAYLVLDMSRDLLLYAAAPTADSWLVLAAWAVGTCAFGLWFFWRAEERYGRE